MLNTSAAAIDLIKKQQGLSLEKYRDDNGIEIIGYGHVIQHGENFHGLITPEEAERLLYNDIQIYEALLRGDTTRSITQHQHDTLVLLMFSFADKPRAAKAIAQAVVRV